MSKKKVSLLPHDKHDNFTRLMLSEPTKKLNAKVEKWILDFRTQRNLGARRIQIELIRLHIFLLKICQIIAIQNGFSQIRLR